MFQFNCIPIIMSLKRRKASLFRWKNLPNHLLPSLSVSFASYVANGQLRTKLAEEHALWPVPEMPYRRTQTSADPWC